MRIALLQINPVIGDFAGNIARIEEFVRKAAEGGADLCLTPELAVIGYPPRDLLLYEDFLERSRAALAELAARLRGLPPVLAGCVTANGNGSGKGLLNSAVLLEGGKAGAVFSKSLLPTYDVFDEGRYFRQADEPGVLEISGRRLGVTICEDVWNDNDFSPVPGLYANDPVKSLAARGVDAVLNLSASPFSVGKQAFRQRMLGGIAAKYEFPLFMANQAGGDDDLVFDGRSMAFDAQGRLCARGAAFREDIVLTDLEAMAPLAESEPEGLLLEAWSALVTGTRDYVAKCGFKKVLLGLSGGIDSALTACVAAEALGPENVLCVLMPSPYSSRGSVEDSLALSRRLGCRTLTLPIEPAMRAFEEILSEAFAGLSRDVTEENIQARIRGNLLMALSNKYGAMLLTTGNKSELSVGYCTIYGDMSGGLAVISDVPKTMVYALCSWLNENRGETVPQSIISKPPSAELSEGQRDDQSLPPYEILDDILHRYVELRQSPREIIAAGLDADTVGRVAGLVRNAEFKRRQAPPGLKITDRAFGAGWRMPLAARW